MLCSNVWVGGLCGGMCVVHILVCFFLQAALLEKNKNIVSLSFSMSYISGVRTRDTWVHTIKFDRGETFWNWRFSCR